MKPCALETETWLIQNMAQLIDRRTVEVISWPTGAVVVGPNATAHDGRGRLGFLNGITDPTMVNGSAFACPLKL